jgi:hypothetical protein
VKPTNLKTPPQQLNRKLEGPRKRPFAFLEGTKHISQKNIPKSGLHPLDTARFYALYSAKYTFL